MTVLRYWKSFRAAWAKWRCDHEWRDTGMVAEEIEMVGQFNSEIAYYRVEQCSRCQKYRERFIGWERHGE